MRQYGFTLIEVLVVIGIMAVLTAILFPVFSKARESARMSTCSNHQRQLAMAVLIWAQDHDETLPPSDTMWQDLAPTPKILVCPTAGKARRNGYVYNANLGDRPLGDEAFQDNESRVLVTADGLGARNLAVKCTDVEMRHNKRALASFLDGHVQRVAYGQLSAYFVGNLQYRPVPFTSNSRYQAKVLPEGTTISCIGPPDHDWLNHIMADPVPDVTAGSYCRLEFTVPYPDRPFACGISYDPPYMSHGFTCNTLLFAANYKQISVWENPPSNFVIALSEEYNDRSTYAVERMPDGTVTYRVDDKIIFASELNTTAMLQFHFNAYTIGAEVRNLRYCVE